jgi:acetylornithine deacetylase/succinyl-diaminopimelate desuccinylase-like protein
VKGIIKDDNIEVSVPRTGGRAGAAPAARPVSRDSSTDSALYKALVASAGKVWPGVPVTPYLFQAGTDASPWRSRGIPVYGIYPYPISNEDLRRMHGNDERVPVASLDQGTKLIYDTIVAVAAK